MSSFLDKTGQDTRDRSGDFSHYPFLNGQEIAIFINGRFERDGWHIEITENVIRSFDSLVHLTRAESRILNGIAQAGISGYLLSDLPELAGHSSSVRTIHVVRTNISMIKKKLSLIGNDRVALVYNSATTRYFVVQKRNA
jgi:hypothetical protein